MGRQYACKLSIQAGVVYDPNSSIETQLERIMTKNIMLHFFVDYHGLKKENRISSFTKRIWNTR
jgi:hypothetical protein